MFTYFRQRLPVIAILSAGQSLTHLGCQTDRQASLHNSISVITGDSRFFQSHPKHANLTCFHSRSMFTSNHLLPVQIPLQNNSLLLPFTAQSVAVCMLFCGIIELRPVQSRRLPQQERALEGAICDRLDVIWQLMKRLVAPKAMVIGTYLHG